jgi:hypothetical protein
VCCPQVNNFRLQFQLFSIRKHSFVSMPDLCTSPYGRNPGMARRKTGWNLEAKRFYLKLLLRGICVVSNFVHGYLRVQIRLPIPNSWPVWFRLPYICFNYKMFVFSVPTKRTRNRSKKRSLMKSRKRNSASSILNLSAGKSLLSSYILDQCFVHVNQIPLGSYI